MLLLLGTASVRQMCSLLLLWTASILKVYSLLLLLSAPMVLWAACQLLLRVRAVLLLLLLRGKAPLLLLLLSASLQWRSPRPSECICDRRQRCRQPPPRLTAAVMAQATTSSSCSCW
jgi:hypothetical protein